MVNMKMTGNGIGRSILMRNSKNSTERSTENNHQERKELIQEMKIIIMTLMIFITQE